MSNRFKPSATELSTRVHTFFVGYPSSYRSRRPRRSAELAEAHTLTHVCKLSGRHGTRVRVRPTRCARPAGVPGGERVRRVV